MSFGRRVALLAALAVVLAAAAGGTTARSAPDATGKTKLTAFGTCGQLLGYAKGQAKRFVGPYGFGGGVRTDVMPTATPPETARAAAPKQGVDFSGTNVQEEGVDEPDIVKTDGNTLFAVANGKLNAVDVGGPKPRLLDSLALEPSSSHELLLHGDRLLVLSRGGYWIEPLPGDGREDRCRTSRRSRCSPRWTSPIRARLRLVRTLTLDGSYVAARLVGGGRPDRRRRADAVRAAVRAAHRRLARGDRRRRPAEPTPFVASLEGRRAGSRPTGSSAPARRPARRARSSSAATSAARPSFSGLGMLTVLTVDLAKGLEPVDSVAVMTDGRIVYASPGEPLRRDRALGRPARPGQADAGAGRRPDRRSTSSTSRAR